MRLFYPPYIVLTLLLVHPVVVWGKVSNFDGLMAWTLNLIEQLSVIAFSGALLVFFWGLVKFILHAGSSEDHKKGISLMTWGLVAFFVLVSIFAIVSFLQNSVGVDNTRGMPSHPTITI